MYKDYLQSCAKIRKLVDDKGLPAPPRGSSEEIQRSNYLQIQKCFTLALLVLLVANIISGCATGTGEVMNESVSHQTQSIPRDARASKSIQLLKQFPTYLPWWISPDISPLVVPVCASRALVTGH